MGLENKSYETGGGRVKYSFKNFEKDLVEERWEKDKEQKKISGSLK